MTHIGFACYKGKWESVELEDGEEPICDWWFDSIEPFLSYVNRLEDEKMGRRNE